MRKGREYLTRFISIVVSIWLVLAPATVINTKIGLDHLSLEACLMA